MWRLPEIAAPSRRYLKGSASPDIPNLSSGLEVSKSQGAFEWSSTSFIISHSDFDTIHIFMIWHICHLVKKWPVRSYRLPDFKNVSVFLFSCCAALTLASSQTLMKLLIHLPLPIRMGEDKKNKNEKSPGSMQGQFDRWRNKEENKQPKSPKAREITHHLPSADRCKASQGAVVIFLANKNPLFFLCPWFSWWTQCYVVKYPLWSAVAKHPGYIHSQPLDHPQPPIWGSRLRNGKILDAMQMLFSIWVYYQYFLTTNPKHSTVWVFSVKVIPARPNIFCYY